MNIGLSNPSPEFCFQDTAQCLYLRSKIGRQKHVGYRRFSYRLYTLIQTEVITQMQSFSRYTDEWEKRINQEMHLFALSVVVNDLRPLFYLLLDVLSCIAPGYQTRRTIPRNHPQQQEESPATTTKGQFSLSRVHYCGGSRSHVSSPRTKMSRTSFEILAKNNCMLPPKSPSRFGTPHEIVDPQLLQLHAKERHGCSRGFTIMQRVSSATHY